MRATNAHDRIPERERRRKTSADEAQRAYPQCHLLAHRPLGSDTSVDFPKICMFGRRCSAQIHCTLQIVKAWAVAPDPPISMKARSGKSGSAETLPILP